jgi:hypothetical protein
MPRPGRREHRVWACYGPRLEELGRKCKLRCCKGCGKQVLAQLDRALLHAERCEELHKSGMWKVMKAGTVQVVCFPFPTHVSLSPLSGRIGYCCCASGWPAYPRLHRPLLLRHELAIVPC